MKIAILAFSTIALFFFLAAVAICQPQYLSDSNKFLSKFIGEQIISVLGVILAINFASLAQLHLSLNKLEEENSRETFQKARSEIKSASRYMISLFAVSGIVLVIKGAACAGEKCQAVFNALELFILCMFVAIMIDIVESVFDLPPNIKK